MGMTVEQLISEARQLPPEQLAELLDRLGEVVHGGVSSEVADEWNRVAQERLAEIESGRVQPISGEEAMARLRQRIGR